MRVIKTVAVVLTKNDIVNAVSDAVSKQGISMNLKSVQFTGSIENPQLRFEGEEIPVIEETVNKRKRGGE